MSTISELRGTIAHQTFVESIGNAASTGNLPVWRAPAKCQIVGVQAVPSAAITANATNYATYTLTRHTAGASAATVADRIWDTVTTDDSAALVSETWTLSGTAANLLLASGDTLTLVKTVASSGLLIPALLIVVSYRWTGV